jgi:hypothetical protein
MKINNSILDFATIYASFSLNETIKILDNLREAKDDLEGLLEILQLEATEADDSAFEINLIETQLEYANKNIKTLETVIMCYETKIFEKATICDKVAVLCMN